MGSLKISNSEKKYFPITIVLCIIGVINPLSHFLQNLFKISLSYYLSYICWGALFIYEVSFLKAKLIKKRTLAVFILFINFSIGTFLGSIYMNMGISEIHVAVMICVAFLASTCFDEKTIKIKKSDINVLFKVLVILGIIASIYALIFQYKSMISVLSGYQTEYNAWKYISFFSQRNIFGEYCFITSIASVYLYIDSKKTIYFISTVLFGFQIYITNSRGSLMAYIILVALTAYFKAQRKKLLIFSVIIVLTILFISFDFKNILISRFTHIDSSGTSSTGVRLEMWKLAMNFLINKPSIIFGNGIHSMVIFLQPHYEWGSSHNAYVDALFDGGIIYLSIIFFMIIKAYKQIHKNQDFHFKVVLTAALTGFCFYNMFEAGMSLFASNFFSVTVTIIFIMLPMYYKGDNNESCTN